MWFAKRAFPHQLGGVLQLPRHRMNAGDCQSFVSGQWWQQLRQLVRQMGFSAAWWTDKKQMMSAGRGQGMVMGEDHSTSFLSRVAKPGVLGGGGAASSAAGASSVLSRAGAGHT